MFVRSNIVNLSGFPAAPKALQASELAMLSNIGDMTEDVHTYVLERSMSGSRSGEGPLFGSAPSRSLKEDP